VGGTVGIAKYVTAREIIFLRNEQRPKNVLWHGKVPGASRGPPTAVCASAVYVSGFRLSAIKDSERNAPN
jgi:hypothetical protein